MSSQRSSILTCLILIAAGFMLIPVFMLDDSQREEAGPQRVVTVEADDTELTTTRPTGDVDRSALQDIPDQAQFVETSRIIPIDRVESTNPELLQQTPPERPRLAVLIDDAGLDPVANQAILDLDYPITIAILPYAQTSQTLSARAAELGLAVFVHLPMEPGGLEDPGPFAITSVLNEEQMALRLQWAFAQVPEAVGFNNHMGSRMTQSSEIMNRIFNHVPGDVRYFVDSLTHPDSLAGDLARQRGLKSAKRDVFLDHINEADAIATALELAISTALDQGQAILIAHPRPLSLEALSTLKDRADRDGIDLVTIPQLLEQSGETPGL